MTIKNKKRANPFWRRLFYCLTVFSLLAVLGLVVGSLSRQIYKQKKITEEISKLQEEIDSLEKENNELGELTQYLQSDIFKEKEAKNKLNLIREGEKLVLVKENEEQKKVAVKSEEKPEINVKRENYYFWWQYFFGIK